MATETIADGFFRPHHTGYLVKDINRSACELVNRFRYKIVNEVIEDPIQTAFVQFFRLSYASVLLELVAPNGDASKLSNALKKRGEGMHHTCFRVEDIEVACQHLRNHRMFMIANPTPAPAFLGHPIAWFMDSTGILIELVELPHREAVAESISKRL